MVLVWSFELKFYLFCFLLPRRCDEPTGRALFGPVGTVVVSWFTGPESVIKEAIIRSSNY